MGWRDWFGDTYTEQVLDYFPNMRFLNAKSIGDEWEAYGGSFVDFASNNPNSIKTRTSDDESWGNFSRQYLGGEDSSDRRQREPRQRQRDQYQPSRQQDPYDRNYNYQEPDPRDTLGGDNNTFFKRINYEDNHGSAINDLLSKYGFTSNSINLILKENPNISEQEVRELARATKDAINTGNVKASKATRKLGVPKSEENQLSAVMALLNSGGDYQSVVDTYRDSDIPIGEGEALNMSDPDSLSGLSMQARKEGLRRSNELFKTAKEDKKKLDDRSDDMFDRSEEERERRLDLEDDVLDDVEESRKRSQEERLAALENYRQSRSQYQDDRVSRTSLMNEIRNAPSTFEEAQRQGHEQSLKNTAALAAVLPTRGGGSAVKSLLDKQQELDLNVASSSAVGRLQEIENRRGMLGNLLGQNQQAAQAQQQLDQQSQQAAVAGGNLDLQYAQIPMSISRAAGASSQADANLALQQRQLGLSAVGLSGNFGQGMLGTDLNIQKFFSDEEDKEYQKRMQQIQLGLSTASALTGGLADLGYGAGKKK